MTTIVLDTHKTINKLVERGFTKEQAEGVIETLTESQLITKDDLKLAMAVNRAWVAGMLLVQAAVIVAVQNLLG